MFQDVSGGLLGGFQGVKEGFCWVQGSVGCSRRVFFLGCYKAFMGVTRGYSVFQGGFRAVFGGFRGFQDVPRGLLGAF